MYRSWRTSSGRVAGGSVKLQETRTVTGPSSGVTVATTKSGPIENGGWGLVARKTWAGAAAGATVRKTAARARVSAPGGAVMADAAGAVSGRLPLSVGALTAPEVTAASTGQGLTPRSYEAMTPPRSRRPARPAPRLDGG